MKLFSIAGRLSSFSRMLHCFSFLLLLFSCLICVVISDAPSTPDALNNTPPQEQAGAAALRPPVFTIGCSVLQLPDSSSNGCFLAGTELLPYIHILDGAIHRNLTSAEECQKRCVEFDDCHYFTFKENTVTKSTICILKPKLSDAASPVMFSSAVANEAHSRFKITSGPKVCSPTACNDGTELVTACGPSTPGSCSLLGPSVEFDANCATADDATRKQLKCGKFGFACCRECSSPSACCRSSNLKGWALDGGVIVGGTKWLKVENPEHCRSVCVRSKICTHWNYISSSIMQFIGGSCYLRQYSPINEPSFKQAPSYKIESVIGSVDCSLNYGLQFTTTTSTLPINTERPDAQRKDLKSQNPYDFNGVPLNREDPCFFSNIDVHDGALYKKWGLLNATECQRLCQIWPGCKSFIYQGHEFKCELKYTRGGMKHSVDPDFVWGPRSCPGAEAVPAEPAGCTKGDVDIIGENVDVLPAEHAAECGEKCRWFGHCKGWTFIHQRCYLKTTAFPEVPSVGVASGDTSCVWPDYSNSRRALHAVLIEESCVHQNQAFAHSKSDAETSELVNGVESLEMCRLICLTRRDCAAMSYSEGEGVCRVYWEKMEESQLVESPGFVSMMRECDRAEGKVECETDQCTSQ